MAKKRKSVVGQEAGQSSSKSMPTFDAELDALFSAAIAKPAGEQKAAAAAVAVAADSENEERESEDEQEDDNSNKDSSAVDLDSEDDEEGVLASDSDSESNAPPLHETLVDKKGKQKAKQNIDEPREIRDKRSLFVGNLPISMIKSRATIKTLKKHLIDCSPYPSLTRIEAIRFRSIPFSKPTDDYNSVDAKEADRKQRQRERAKKFRELQNGEREARTPLTGSQKRKVAFITQQVNEKADSVNAYITLEHVQDKHREGLPNADRVTAPILAALLARTAQGSMFEGRHLRVDLVTALLPHEIIESGLDKIKTPDGSLLGGIAGSSGVDTEARRRTAFVGNIDFEAKEEELRAFFNTLLTSERGEAPAVSTLDFSQCTNLPAPEFTNRQTATWIQDVRMIRDAATQMGKGFAYVRFVDVQCVDELIAIYESEEALLAAVKRGKSTIEGQFRRKLKFKQRALRVSRCKVPKISASSRTGGGTPKQSPRAIERTRSSGAPTPGGTSPFLKRGNTRGGSSNDSPMPKSKRPRLGSSKAEEIANPPPKYDDPLRAAQVARKKADPERQAKRQAKKDKKRAALKAAAKGSTVNGKVSLKPSSSNSSVKGHKKVRKAT